MNSIEKIIASTITKSTIEAIQKQLAEQFRSMTVGDILGGKSPKLNAAPARRTKSRRNVRDTNLAVVGAIKKLHAAANDQWCTIDELAKRAGVRKPASHLRRMMLHGFRAGGKFQKPLFQGNGCYTNAFRLRRSKV